MSYKRPESVLVVIYARTGEVLLLERTAPEGYWQSVTGSLDEGETPSEAARREVGEETGLVDVVLQDLNWSHRYPIIPAWRHRYAPDVTDNLEHVFAVCVDEPCAVILSPREHVRYQWLGYVDALERVSSSTNRDAIVRLLG